MEKTEDKRRQAVHKVAREALSIELGMEHRESIHSIGVVELERALEMAYELGRRSALS
jgi:hypothetical protein